MAVLMVDLLVYIQTNIIEILFGVIFIIFTLVIFSMFNDGNNDNDNDNDNNINNNIQRNELTDVTNISDIIDNNTNTKNKFVGNSVTFEAMEI